jgi:ERF superfamily
MPDPSPPQPEIIETPLAAEASTAPPAVVPGGSPPSFPSGADPILAMIERAARDPEVNVDKFERLMGMRRALEAERASIAFAEAFAELGPDLPAIDRNGRILIYAKALRDRAEKEGPQVFEGQLPQQKTAYATLDDILEALRRPLSEHGFSLRFEHETQAVGDSFRIISTAVLRHRLGHEERASTPPLQHDASGSKNAVQAVGSALTYGRRYALMALLPIVSHAPQDADDDGRGAVSPPIDADQLAYIEQQLRDTDSNVPIFLATLGARGALAELTVKQYQRGLELLAEKKRRAKAAMT